MKPSHIQHPVPKLPETDSGPQINYGIHGSLAYEKATYIPDIRKPQFAAPTLSGLKSGGSFTAYPEGLQIDHYTGKININESESGLAYTIRYTSPDGQHTVSTNLEIHGVHYLSGKFHLKRKFLMKPVLGNHPVRKSTKNIFDEPEQLGLFNENAASKSGLAINKQTGVINVKQTIKNLANLEGPLQSGFNKKFKIFYKIKDVVSKIEVIIYYYDNSADIPVELNSPENFMRGTQIQSSSMLPFSMVSTSSNYSRRPPRAVGVA